MAGDYTGAPGPGLGISGESCLNAQPEIHPRPVTCMSLAILRQWVATPVAHYRLFHNFVRQDFTAQYAGSMAGFLWLFVTPIVNICIYAFVFSAVFGVRPPTEFGRTSFVIFMMVGYLPWFAFADALGKAPSLLLEKAPLITKVMLPVQIIPVTGALIPYMTHGIGFGLLLVFLALQGYVSWLWLWLPVIFSLQLLFSLGLVAVLSAFCVFLRDLQQLVSLLITTWFFLTPVVYPLSIIESDAVRGLYLFNPMHSFVECYRQIVLLDTFPLVNFQIVLGVSLASYLLGGWLFMRIRHAFGDVL